MALECTAVIVSQVEFFNNNLTEVVNMLHRRHEESSGEVIAEVYESKLNELKFERMKYDRMGILLKAMCDIVKKLGDSYYTLSFFEQTAVWDDTSYDDWCLYEEAKEVLDIE